MASRRKSASKRRARKRMQVQSLLFSRDEFTVSKAKSWAVRHGFKAKKVHVTANKIRLRQVTPHDFHIIRTKRFGKGLEATVGK